MQGLIINAARLCSVFALLKTAFAFLHTGSASLPFRNRGSSEALALKGGNTPSSDLKTHDILIVGAGYLGQLVAKEWQLKYPGSTVYAETRTDAKHSNLKDMGVVPLLRSERENHPFKEWKTVVFCAAPKGNDDYPGELKTAISLWTGDGHFVFTSSGASELLSQGLFSSTAAMEIFLGTFLKLPMAMKLILGLTVRVQLVKLKEQAFEAYIKSAALARPREVLLLNFCWAPMSWALTQNFTTMVIFGLYFVRGRAFSNRRNK